MGRRIAIDLGGTYLRVGVIENNKILEYVNYETPKNKKKLLKLLVKLISDFMVDVEGIGVATPGPLKEGVIKNTPNLPLKNFDLKKFLKRRFKTRVEVENDADCVALAEFKLGCKKKNFFVVTIGTGIGGGIFVNGELYKGKNSAGEVGHIILEDGKDWEYWWKFYRRMSKDYFGRDILFKELLKMKNKKSREILNESSDVLAKGISSLINIFDPEVVILSGGIKETGRKFLKYIKKDSKKYIFLPGKFEIRWTKLKHPGMLGASLLLD